MAIVAMAERTSVMARSSQRLLYRNPVLVPMDIVPPFCFDIIQQAADRIGVPL